VNVRFNSIFLELSLNELDDFAEKVFPGLPAGVYLIFDLLVPDRIDILESEIFELAAHLSHAQTVSEGRVDVQGLLRDLQLQLKRKVLQGPHIVQPVGKLNKDNAYVVHHRQYHLADILGLALFAVGQIDLLDLSNAFDDVRDLFTKQLLDLFDRDRRVFNSVMQQPG